MHDLALKQSFFITFVLFMIISLSWHVGIVTTVQGESPSFVRQEIIDSSGDWIFWKGSSSSPSNKTQLNTHEGNIVEVEKADNPSECEIGKDGNYIPPPDIQSVSYISDGKKLNATVWLTSPFEEPPLNDTIDIFQEEIKIMISPTNGTLREYTDVNLARLLDPFETEIQENATTLSGNQAYSVVYNDRIGNNEVKVMQTWTVIGNKAYDIVYTALPTKFEEYLPKIQELIDTFEIESPTANSSVKGQSKMIGNSLKYESSGININYPLDWVKEETKNNDVTTIIFRSPFEDTELERPSWHEITFTMAIDIDSVHDAGTDYRVIYSRIPDNMWTGNWARQVREISAYDKTRILEEYNHTYFYDKRDPSHILFSFDLDDANSPKQYKAVFYVTDYFVKDHVFCTLTDTTNWVIIPPPDFSMSSEPSSVLLRPGEEKNLKLEIKGNTDLESEAAVIPRNSYTDEIQVSVSPNKTSVSPSASGSSTLHLKVLDGAEAKPYTFPVIANISFPTSITNRGGETFSNNRSVSIVESSNLTLTVLPPYTTQEHLTNFTNAWITPVSGIWTFLAGVGAVVAPVIIALYRKKRKRNSVDSTR
jgi:hypothetical protein